jgi:hypothetical protein
MQTALFVMSLIVSGLIGWFTAIIMMAPSMAEKNRKILGKDEDED